MINSFQTLASTMHVHSVVRLCVLCDCFSENVVRWALLGSTVCAY